MDGEKLDFRGLKAVIRRHEKNGGHAKNMHWQLEQGADESIWLLSYRYTPVLNCVNYKLRNICLDQDEFFRVCDAIKAA